MLVYLLFLQEQIKDIIIIIMHFLCAFLAFCVCTFLHFFAQQLQCKKRGKNACCAKQKSAKNVQKMLPVTLYCADIKMTENVATRVEEFSSPPSSEMMMIFY
jgi:hypothetical protein